MPASQTGFGNLFLDRSVMSAGYHIPVLACPAAVQQQQQQQQHHLAAMATGVPITYSGLQGYSFIPYPHSRHMANMNNGFDLKPTSPYHHALLARGAAFYPHYRPGAAEDPGRVAKVATRESTGALKAWLNEHLKNPYPTKGEKIMLAIITKMSLTQVSTWFANARRRLKKENRVSWATKGKSDEEDDEQEGESDEEDVSLQKCSVDEREDADPRAERADDEGREQSALESSASVGARLESAASVGARLESSASVGARLESAAPVDARLESSASVGARLESAASVGARLESAASVGARLESSASVGARLESAASVGARLERAAPVDARLETQPSDARGDTQLTLSKKAETSDSDHTSSTLESKENVSQKPKIWSLAETATSETVKKPVDHVYQPAGKLWAEWASRTGLLVPTRYTTHEIV